MNQLVLRLKEEKTTQVQDVLAYLEMHGSITPMEALRELGIFRLAARVFDLEQMGHVIPREPYHGTGRNGRRFVVTKYLRP